jgi:Invasion associated locus B (IalB) protein
MTSMRVKYFVATTAIALLVGGTAFAQTPSQIGKFSEWGSYAYKSGNGKVCYILTIPKTKKPDAVDHGDNFFLVSQKPGQNVAYEPQFMAGYELQANSKVIVTVGDKSFSMFTSGKSAWMENAAEEPLLLAAMKGGQSMAIKATSKRGTATNYTYSLAGISKALDSVKSCK